MGTAGHIDHGKTALVNLLTGVDTDRLKEEKARGISIDLGFAQLGLSDGTTCGIVDVPGHERFVKNMLAGACGLDAVILVIAADEGVMPQTREHLDIISLLGIKHGLVALTKTDMVESDWLDLVTESVGEYLHEQGFGDFPLVPVSSKTGEGKEAILSTLESVLNLVQSRPDLGVVRLPVDRAFIVEGFGTVVTGTLWQGRIAPGDRLAVEPEGLEVRVRNVQVHSRDAEEARAGQRTAVALPGLDIEKVPRGSWLMTPDAADPSHMLDVRLRVLPNSSVELKRRQRVRFHLGASEILARVVPLESEVMLPGAEGLAQVRLESPGVAQRGDRFVLRTYSPARAFAGGEVLVPKAAKHKLSDAGAVERLHALEHGGPEQLLNQALDDARVQGVLMPDLQKQLEMEHAELKELIAKPDSGLVVVGEQTVIKKEALAQIEMQFPPSHGAPPRSRTICMGNVPRRHQEQAGGDRPWGVRASGRANARLRRTLGAATAPPAGVGDGP